MPMVDDGSGNLVAQVVALAQLARQKAQQQGANQIDTALPGQTVSQVGMSPKQFAALFGKDTPYNPNKILKEEKSSDFIDRQYKSYLQTLDPKQLLDIIATKMTNDSGVAGATTMEGLDASRKTAEVKSKTGLITAQSVSDLVGQGLKAMDSQPAEVKDALGQTLAFGTTASDVEHAQLKNQIGIASLREVIKAQTDPKAPIHKFLQANGLDLPTVMAGTALGLNNLFDNYSRMIMSGRDQDKSFELAILRSRLETAQKMSADLFKGKLSPNQVLAVMDAKEKGTPIPRGLEGAAQLYDQAIEVNYNAAISEALRKGDPFVQAMESQIQALTKPGVDPNTLKAVQDLSARIAARSMTLNQVGEMPNDPAGRARWDAVYMANLNRVPKSGIHVGIFQSGSSTGPTGEGAGMAPAMAPTNAPAAPAAGPVRPVAPINSVPAANSILSPAVGGNNSLPAPNSPPNPSQLTPDQQAAVTTYLKSIGMSP